jgi:chromosome segregation ATPase
MANSDETMKRLARVEATVVALAADVVELKTAAWRTTEILTDHSEQLMHLRQALGGLNERADGLNERVDGLNERVDSLNERVDGLGTKMDGVNERLDRLIAVTMQERTGGAQRLGEIERRLARLEERLGT